MDDLEYLRMKEAIRRAHDYLDSQNFIHGDKDALCLLCGAVKYDSKQGVVHAKSCLIMALRKHIKE